MTTDQKQPKDLLAYTDRAQLPGILRKRGEALVTFARADLDIDPGTELSFALAALVDRIGHEVIRLAHDPHDAEHAARAVRNVFECGLIIRHIAASQESTIQWIALRVKEEADILRRSLVLGDKSSSMVAPIHERINQVEDYLADRGIDTPKPLPRWNVLARTHGLESDYEALYGVFSKYVHPSAWTIVQPDVSWNPLFAELFLVHAQFYAISAAQYAADALCVSSEPLSTGPWRESV